MIRSRGQSLIDEISALIKEVPEGTIAPFYQVRTQSEGASYNSETELPPDSQPACTMLFDLNPPDVRNKFLLFMNYPVSGILL